MREHTTVLVGLGSNLAWRDRTSRMVINDSLERLQEVALGPVRRSALYRTSPVDCPPGSGEFVNAAAAFEVAASMRPIEMLRVAKAIEAEFGRGQTLVRNAPRQLDLDLLAFGDVELQTEKLTLPHPRAHLRAFVLVPLSEVAPDFVWPGMDRTVTQLMDSLSSDEIVQAIPAADCRD